MNKLKQLEETRKVLAENRVLLSTSPKTRHALKLELVEKLNAIINQSGKNISLEVKELINDILYTEFLKMSLGESINNLTKRIIQIDNMMEQDIA